MASKTESLCSLLILCVMITSCVGQTFQYSRGWVNGKVSVEHEIYLSIENLKSLSNAVFIVSDLV